MAAVSNHLALAPIELPKAYQGSEAALLECQTVIKTQQASIRTFSIIRKIAIAVLIGSLITVVACSIAGIAIAPVFGLVGLIALIVEEVFRKKSTLPSVLEYEAQKKFEIEVTKLIQADNTGFTPRKKEILEKFSSTCHQVSLMHFKPAALLSDVKEYIKKLSSTKPVYSHLQLANSEITDKNFWIQLENVNMMIQSLTSEARTPREVEVQAKTINSLLTDQIIDGLSYHDAEAIIETLKPKYFQIGQFTSPVLVELHRKLHKKAPPLTIHFSFERQHKLENEILSYKERLSKIAEE